MPLSETPCAKAHVDNVDTDGHSRVYSVCIFMQLTMLHSIYPRNCIPNQLHILLSLIYNADLFLFLFKQTIPRQFHVYFIILKHTILHYRTQNIYILTRFLSDFIESATAYNNNLFLSPSYLISRTIKSTVPRQYLYVFVTS